MSANLNPRIYATIVYPESAPDGWMEVIESYHIEAFVSPLHDKDKWTKEDEKKNPEHKEGNLKKPHYHVMLMFKGKKTPIRVLEIIESFGGVGMEIVENTKGMARYLCHLDNDDKEKYRMEDVKSFGGACYEKVCKFEDDDPMRCIEEMMDFCDDNNIKTFYVLARYARNYRKDWHRVLATKSTNFIREYLKSKVYCDQNYGDLTDYIKQLNE